MAHGRRAGAISDIAAPSPPLRSGSGLTSQSGEDRRRLVGAASEPAPCALVNGDKDHLTPPVPATQCFRSHGPHPEDMDDTCSEYDNVGSDVEQDCEEVLRLSREAGADLSYCKQACAAVGDDVNEMSRGVDQHAPRSRHSTEALKGLQSGAKAHQASRSFRPYCAPSGKDEAERGVEKGHENRFLFSDGDEVEEVLDGARFIEDLDDTGSGVPTQTRLQDQEKERIGKRGDDARATRKKNAPGGCKTREERRGRRGTGEDMERVVSAVKGSTTCSADQRPKTTSKDSKKGSERSKARSSRQHPPPSPHHPHSPASAQKAQQHREMPHVPEPAPSSLAGPGGQPRVFKPSPASPQAPEGQEEPLEDADAGPESSQQVPSTTAPTCKRVTIMDAHMHAE